MNITLLDAVDELRATLDQVDPETGLLPEGFESVLGLVKNKSAKVGAFILQTEAEADFVEAHAKALLARVKAARRRTEWLRGYLLTGMREAGITSISIEGLAKIVRYPERDESVELWDEKQIPEEFFEPQPPKVSKQLIKEAIKGGTEIPGAKLIRRDRLSIK